ncbi:MAG: DegV family protein [Bacillota bacterium]
MKIGILTDSTCDLPENILNEYDINVIPLTVSLENKQYKDKVDITSEQFFKKIKNTDQLPTTSQPSAGEFAEIYDKLNQQYDHILSIHLSEHLSGTIQSAKLALKENPEFNVTIIDSKSTSMGLGFLVILAAKLINMGYKLDKLINILEMARKDIKIYLTVDNLSYLQKGGRINKAESFIGNLINLKPILKLDFNSTSVEPIGKVRGNKNIHKKFVSYVESYVAKNESENKYWFGLLYGEHEYVTEFENKFQEYLNSKKINYDYYENNVGPVIGSHTGPSVYGIILFKGGKYLDE